MFHDRIFLFINDETKLLIKKSGKNSANALILENKIGGLLKTEAGYTFKLFDQNL